MYRHKNVKFYSKTNLSGTQRIILYDNQGNPKYYLSFTTEKKVSLLVENDYYTKGNKDEEWISVVLNGVGIFYAKKKDVKNKFWTLKDLMLKGGIAIE